MRSSCWLLVGLLFLVTPARAKQLSLAEDFQNELKRGITFFFSGGPDEGIFVTFRGSGATFRYLDG